MRHKLNFYLLLVFFSVFVVESIKAQAPYCTPTFTYGCQTNFTNDFINNFSTTNGITNIVNNNSGCNYMPNNYIYYPNKILTVAQGCSFNFTIQCGAIYQQGFAIWIDYNQNNSFTDPGEFVWNSGSAGFQVFNGVVTVPASALTGNTRMRVRSNFAATPSSPCAHQTYGEVEDYMVIIEPAATIPPVGVNDTICAGQNGQVTATGNGTLQWFTVPAGGTVIQTGGTLNTPVLNNTTTYYVQSVLGGCTSPRTPVTVVVSPAFTLNITASADTVCAGGQVTLTGSGTNLTYLWAPALMVNNSTGNPVTATVNTPTTFTLVATNPTGCSVTASKTIEIYPTPVLNTIVNPNAICLGDTAIVTVSGASNCTWTGNYLFANNTNDSIWVAPSATSTYSVSATASNGCVGTQTATVNVNLLPPANAGSDINLCSGASATLNGSGGVSYSWSPSNGLSATNINNPSVTLTSNQAYILNVTDANGCINSDTMNVNVIPLPIANPGTNTAVCIGDSVTLNGSGGTQYTWSPATGLSNASIANPVCTPASTTSYTLTVSDGTCTSLPSSAITVTVHNQPAAPLITAGGVLSFCQGGSVTLTSSASGNNVWSNGATTNSITVNTSGTYTVYYVDANGCSSAVSSAVTVVVHPLPPAPVITASGPLTVCNGGSVVLSSSVANTYSWSNGANTQSINLNSSGSYTVTITDGNGCTSTSAATVFTVLPPPTAPVITASGPLSFCTGDSVILTSTPSASYLWSNGATTQSITVFGSGSYTVTTTNAGGCVSPVSAVTNTTMFPVPAAPVITANGPLTFCNGGNVVLTSTPAAAYSWSNTFNTQSITVISSGTYNLSVIDNNGCPSPLSNNIVVVVNPIPPAPVITALGPTTFCEGGSVTLQSNQPNGNLWNNGSTQSSISVSISGNYSVTYTDANNCVSVASNPVMVTAMPLAPTPTITASGPTTFCVNDSVTLTCSQAQTYLWSNGSTTPSITVYTAGTYTVTVTDVCNPANPQANISILVNPNPVVSFQSSKQTDCLPATIEFTNTSNNVVSSQWSFGDGGISNQFNPIYIYNFAGIYSVSLTAFDANGCSSTKTMHDYIEIFPMAEIKYSISPKVTDLLNSNVEFKNITPNSLCQHWVIEQNGSSYKPEFTHTFENPGVYEVKLTVTTDKGCVETVKDSIVIEENYHIFFPNAFTPNGDGLNDVFAPSGSGVKDFRIEIYNRWGLLVYVSNSFNQPWDGGDNIQDNYIWRVYLTDNKGTTREMTGSVTLIR
ncbi:MAG: gliding motility-associated C-terminal domain-containing protein [Bacteroidia bacterium]|nr:gliding motility-associated C-terminal domain-containing protein [Bacteroidia bacterium]MCZ2247979.1 GEVED domain-containing protein [Bacteroidia bacterium]